MKENIQLVIVSNTKANLIRENKVWSNKVLILEENTGKYKRGDNVRPYAQLDYTLHNTINDDLLAALSNKNQPNGVAVMNDDGVLLSDIMPDTVVSIDDTIVIDGGTAATADALYESFIKNK